MNFFLCFDQKPPLLYNYVFTEVVPFRKYCHIYIHTYIFCSSQLLLMILSRRMTEADNKSWSIFLSVVDVYVVRTSSLNDKHSCQKSFQFVLLSSSVSTANLSCFLVTTFSSLRFLFNFTSLQSFESGQRGFLFSHFRVLSSILSLSFLCSSVSEALFALNFSFLSERFFFVIIKLL